MTQTVSRETQDRLDVYRELLFKWQVRINLVAPASLAEADVRHFQDSLQLLPLLPTKMDRSSDLIREPHDEGGPRVKPKGLTKEDRALTLVDLGSGAGFPGLVLALARPADLTVHLIESDAKKGEFMRTVSRETRVPVTVHTARIEAVPPFFVDVITARALAPLPDLLAYALPWAAVNLAVRLVFLKGETWAAEVETAQQVYDFTLTSYPSATHSKARILVVENLRMKEPPPP